MIGYIKKYGVEIILILAYIGIMLLVAQIMYTPYDPPSLNIEKNMITGKYVAVSILLEVFNIRTDQLDL